MIAAQVLVFFLSLLHVSLAAPVTLYQTTTAVTYEDGSQYSYNPTADATSAVAASAAATGEVSDESSSSSGSSGSSIWSTLSNWLSSYSSSSGTSRSGSTSGSSSGSTSGSSSGSGFSFSSWLKGLFGNDDNSDSGNDSYTSSASTQQPSTSAPSSTSTGGGWFDTKTSSTAQQSSTTSSDSTSTGGIYDAIYDSSEDIDKKFAKDILDAHNKYRAQHGVDELSWDEGPYKYAKKNADDYDCSGVLTHTHGQYGENLAAGFSNGPSAVKAWFDEGESYDYSSHNEYNHFTQVVWKGSKKVGCAYKDCRSNNWGLYIVCEYDPVGNVIGQEAQNVLKPVSS
ncbi:uncharacterized protein CXQ87_000900 [Candidozyma duobushaemuli]|uniref:SCP domain-containing protein n=2 Tax=Candidozyma TaxID=3303203 RepID=A0ABX8I0A7_9ASCO|nr:uncharacterized protein CXQ87_000900 [[Candida] duobushaemulonis]PVH17990.1 hypothetical protein CXQ87_000900 [[Candida] duobushaemulonis]QWU86569.1 hypothetical protein CA3LBN_000787 [[Candida] haemuloni]